ncbi:MAG: hypothetical protein mread185_000521 [Mycoplasmataceae bacterium]|nr:MAG: hypothetical protein mread185_000521 [Mycoplasmataceae bacterium]
MKCGFVDCNNSKARECKDSCQSCKERKEWSICWACNKKARESEEGLRKLSYWSPVYLSYCQNFLYDGGKV